MNRIVRQHFPAEKLPPELREGLEESAQVTVPVETETGPAERRPTLDEIFARRRPPFLTKEEIDRRIRELRDEWD